MLRAPYLTNLCHFYHLGNNQGCHVHHHCHHLLNGGGIAKKPVDQNLSGMNNCMIPHSRGLRGWKTVSHNFLATNFPKRWGIIWNLHHTDFTKRQRAKIFHHKLRSSQPLITNYLAPLGSSRPRGPSWCKCGPALFLSKSTYATAYLNWLP